MPACSRAKATPKTAANSSALMTAPKTAAKGSISKATPQTAAKPGEASAAEGSGRKASTCTPLQAEALAELGTTSVTCLVLYEHAVRSPARLGCLLQVSAQQLCCAGAATLAVGEERYAARAAERFHFTLPDQIRDAAQRRPGCVAHAAIVLL